MKTIICDMDGTLTNLWPLEKCVLSYLLPEVALPEIEKLKQSGISESYRLYRKLIHSQVSKKEYVLKYNQAFIELQSKDLFPGIEVFPLAKWILGNPQYTYVYATGGQKSETLFALQRLGVLECFDLQNSVDKTTCRFSKKTGIPFRKILKKYSDCFLFTDSLSDCEGAKKMGIPFMKLEPGERVVYPLK